MRNYGEVESLANVYLEDSFVIAINESPGKLCFNGEFVLTERHPAYRVPSVDDQYHYEEGRLIFSNIADLTWIRRSFHQFSDATGQKDLGNIDYLICNDGYWLVGGDWGEVRVFTSNAPCLVLN